MSPLFKTSLIAALAGLAASAQAAPAPVETRVVSGAELDLSRHAGAEVMLRRIKTAASALCGPESDRTTLARAALRRACVAEATDRAVAQLGNPQVTALNGGEAPVPTLVASRR